MPTRATGGRFHVERVKSAVSISLLILLGTLPSYLPAAATHSPIPLAKRYWGTIDYPWYCDGSCPSPNQWRHWDHRGHSPPGTWASMYLPDDGSGLYSTSTLYSSLNSNIANRHLSWMDYARLDFALVSWQGQGSFSDQAFQLLLSQNGHYVKLAPYYEPEGTSDPSTASIAADLAYLYDNYALSANYFHVSDKDGNNYPVVFVYAGPNDTLDYVNRWSRAREEMFASGKPFFLNLKVFQGYTSYANLVDGWHQYSPGKRYELQNGFSAFASPGYVEYPELATARNRCGGNTCTVAYEPLQRDPEGFRNAVETMNRLTLSEAKFLLVETFNEWHEGTQIEPGFRINHLETGFTQSGPSYGTVFLDYLRTRGTSLEEFLTDWSDFNQDGKVSIMDVSSLALYFGQTCYAPPALASSKCKYWDLDMNNQITLVEAANTALHFGRALDGAFLGHGITSYKLDAAWQAQCQFLPRPYSNYCVASFG